MSQAWTSLTKYYILNFSAEYLGLPDAEKKRLRELPLKRLVVELTNMFPAGATTAPPSKRGPQTDIGWNAIPKKQVFESVEFSSLDAANQYRLRSMKWNDMIAELKKLFPKGVQATAAEYNLWRAQEKKKPVKGYALTIADYQGIDFDGLGRERIRETLEAHKLSLGEAEAYAILKGLIIGRADAFAHLLRVYEEIRCRKTYLQGDVVNIVIDTKEWLYRFRDLSFMVENDRKNLFIRLELELAKKYGTNYVHFAFEMVVREMEQVNAWLNEFAAPVFEEDLPKVKSTTATITPTLGEQAQWVEPSTSVLRCCVLRS